jgi:hypothetical protein
MSGVDWMKFELVAAIVVYAAVHFGMKYCRERGIENPILTFRLWLAERKERG